MGRLKPKKSLRARIEKKNEPISDLRALTTIEARNFVLRFASELNLDNPQ